MEKVIFKKHRGEVIAVFPFIQWYNLKLTCYAHIGQHSAIDLSLAYNLRNAKESEYKDLLNEVKGIYGKVEVLKRMPKFDKVVLNLLKQKHN